MVDDARVPPITAIPSAFCAPEPALDAIASGSTPHTNAIDVIKIGRKRRRIAATAASTSFIPSSIL